MVIIESCNKKIKGRFKEKGHIYFMTKSYILSLKKKLTFFTPERESPMGLRKYVA